MGIFDRRIRWMRTSDHEQINREREREGYIIVSDTEIMDNAAKYIRHRMSPSEKFVGYGNYKPVVTGFKGLPDGPVIEHYECSVDPLGHAITSRLHCAQVGGLPFIIELTYEEIEELTAFLEPTDLPLEKSANPN